MKDWKLEIETSHCHIYIVTTAKTPTAAWRQIEADLREIDLAVIYDLGMGTLTQSIHLLQSVVIYDLGMGKIPLLKVCIADSTSCLLPCLNLLVQ
ncbi:MAG: hypothetical protein ACFFFG_15135 [Candidatus Thorarchaeota archaeon]